MPRCSSRLWKSPRGLSTAESVRGLKTSAGRVASGNNLKTESWTDPEQDLLYMVRKAQHLRHPPDPHGAIKPPRSRQGGLSHPVAITSGVALGGHLSLRFQNLVDLRQGFGEGFTERRFVLQQSGR